MLGNFFSQLREALKDDGAIILELTTSGGEADFGRRIAQQIRICREHLHREMFFVGMTTVYSAGVTIMAAFPHTHRYLAKDTALLIHGRRTAREESPGGPLTAALQVARSKVAELEKGLQLEQQGFAELIAGTDVTDDEIKQCAETNWYLTADEALQRRLVAGLL
jgi:ATP-dependent Clp protease, protease subunit